MAQPFKNLVDRFNAQMDALYAEGSTTDRTAHGVTKNPSPYYEVKPNTPDKRDFGKDTRAVPLQSIAADVTRMGTWARRPEGLRWFLDQQNLQAGNTFAETRVLNPLVLIGNLQPFKHIERSLSDATGMTLSVSPITGDAADKSPGSPDNMGSAGRLQLSTAKHVTNLIVTGGQNNVWQDIVSWIPASRIVNVVNTLTNITDVGILGLDQRPEFDMSGKGTFDDLYSVEIWNGFERASAPVDNLAAVGANLRVGNFSGAVKAASAAVNTVSRDINQVVAAGSSVVNFVGSLFGARGRGNSPSQTPTPTSRAQDDTKAAGRRYFITDGTEGADRYLEGTIDFTPSQDGKTIIPTPSLSFMNRPPMFFDDGSITVLVSDPSPSKIPSLGGDLLNLTPISSAQEDVAKAQDAAVKANAVRNSTLKTTRDSLNADTALRLTITQGPDAAAQAIFSQITQGPGRAIQQQLAGQAALPPHQNSGTSASDNPAEDAMKYSGLSIRQKYLTDEKIASIQAMVDSQRGRWLMSYKSYNPRERAGGFAGGIAVNGTAVDIDASKKFPFNVSIDITPNGTRRYFHDDINAYGPAKQAPGSTYLTKAAMDAIKAQSATPLVDLFFFDFVNKVAVPFRANIRGLNETVAPEYNDVFYIGRTERNIVYIGVRRSVSFSVVIHAFNESEMTGIWTKLNYLTSLCFPSQFSQGYMVPPLIKLTLGDVYNNQPGYIQSLTYNVEDDVPWEISEPMQAPHGITANITFAIIEKTAQMSAKYATYNPFTSPPRFVPLYNYGRKRQSTAASTPKTPPVRTGRPTSTGPAVINQGTADTTPAVQIPGPVLPDNTRVANGGNNGHGFVTGGTTPDVNAILRQAVPSSTLGRVLGPGT